MAKTLNDQQDMRRIELEGKLEFNLDLFSRGITNDILKSQVLKMATEYELLTGEKYRRVYR